jgi:hypothetical protein
MAYGCLVSYVLVALSDELLICCIQARMKLQSTEDIQNLGCVLYHMDLTKHPPTFFVEKREERRELSPSLILAFLTRVTHQGDFDIILKPQYRTHLVNTITRIFQNYRIGYINRCPHHAAFVTV